MTVARTRSPETPARRDGRSTKSRKWRALYVDLCAQLGGPHRLTASQRLLVRRAVGLSLTCESMEDAMAAGADFDGPAYGRLCEQLRRAFGDLGLDEKPAPLRSATTGGDFDRFESYLAARGADRDPATGHAGEPLAPLARGQRRGPWGQPVRDDADDRPTITRRCSASTTIRRRRIPLPPDDDEEDDDADQA